MSPACMNVFSNVFTFAMQNTQRYMECIIRDVITCISSALFASLHHCKMHFSQYVRVIQTSSWWNHANKWQSKVFFKGKKSKINEIIKWNKPFRHLRFLSSSISINALLCRHTDRQQILAFIILDNPYVEF